MNYLKDDERQTLEELMALIRSFIAERKWEHFQKPSSLALSASVEMGELLERFQWLSDDDISKLLTNEEYRESIADEMADIMIYLLRLADTAGIRPTPAILKKMRKNAEKYPASEWRGRIPDKVRSFR